MLLIVSLMTKLSLRFLKRAMKQCSDFDNRPKLLCFEEDMFYQVDHALKSESTYQYQSIDQNANVESCFINFSSWLIFSFW